MIGERSDVETDAIKWVCSPATASGRKARVAVFLEPKSSEDAYRRVLVVRDVDIPW